MGRKGIRRVWRGTLLCQCITPETNSDCLSDGGGEGFSTTGGWDLAAKGGRFQWEEEDREELLIEIALDRGTKGKGKGKDLELDLGFDSDLSFHGEEGNLIEIDISPGRLDDVFHGTCD
ncbi:unnamed protein product [Linum tenue]|uniref:Uncharacterized protein n=1 Tax=Linum tenue TaxID=586396 RepID=A0AAV0PJA1_9ROSI|nr:unnamed protein product [Linum tenue]